MYSNVYTQCYLMYICIVNATQCICPMLPNVHVYCSCNTMYIPNVHWVAGYIHWVTSQYTLGNMTQNLCNVLQCIYPMLPNVYVHCQCYTMYIPNVYQCHQMYIIVSQCIYEGMYSNVHTQCNIMYISNVIKCISAL